MPPEPSEHYEFPVFAIVVNNSRKETVRQALAVIKNQFHPFTNFSFPCLLLPSLPPSCHTGLWHNIQGYETWYV